MPIELVTDDLPIAATKAGQNIKVQRVPPEISVSTAEGSGINGLHIYPRGQKIGKPADPRCYLTDAKMIYAWIIWHLPAGTVEELSKLMASRGL
jgi:hypothetical protein